MKNKKKLLALPALLLSLPLLSLPSKTPSLRSFLSPEVKELSVSQDYIQPLAPISVLASESAEPLRNALPKSTKVYRTDGSVVDGAIEWTLPASIAEIGKLLVKGVLPYFGNAEISVEVTVKKTYELVPISLKVNTGATYDLPSSTTRIFTDGSHESVPVTWTTQKPSSATAGNYPLEGTTSSGEAIEGSVQVIDPVKEDVNVLAGGTINTTEFHSADDGSLATNGVLDDKGVSNWVNRDQHSETTFDKASINVPNAPQGGIVRFEVYYWTGEQGAVLPSSQRIEYYSAGRYVPVTNAVVDPANKNHFTYTLNAPVDDVSWVVLLVSSPQNQWVNISEIQAIRVEDVGVEESSNNYATDIKVNGTSIPNFHGEAPGDVQSVYEHVVPYGTKDADVVVEPILANPDGYVAILPGEIDRSPYKVLVVGEIVRTYNLMLRSKKPEISSLEVVLPEGKSSILPNEAITLSVKGVDAAGNPIDDSSGQVVYTATTVSGYAQVVGRTLTGVLPGAVTISASIEYDGATYQATKDASLTIQEATPAIYPIDAEDVSLTVFLGDALSLPETVEVTLSSGRNMSQPVAWTPSPNLTQRAGKHTVQGYVVGTSLLVNAEVDVVAKGDVASRLVFRTPRNTDPVLPSSLITGYAATGEAIRTEVDWDTSQSNFDQAVGQTTTVSYTSKDGTKTGTATVEIVAGEVSPDYAGVVNGVTKTPQPLASRSDASSQTSFTNKNGKWVSLADDASPYLGFAFGERGGALAAVRQETIDTFKLSFEGTVLPGSVKLQYYTGTPVVANLPDDPAAYLNVESNQWTASEFKGNGNWVDVANQSGAIASETTLTFSPVKTYAIRAVFTKKAASDVLTVTDMVVTGRTYNPQTALPTLSGLEVKANGNALPIEFSPEKDSYQIDVPQDASVEILPTFTSGQQGNSYVLPDLGDGIIRLFITSEEGGAQRSISFVKQQASSARREITAVASLPFVEVASASSFAELKLSSQILATLSDGSTQYISIRYHETETFSGKPGFYTINGSLILPEGIANPRNLFVQAKVRVTGGGQGQAINRENASSRKDAIGAGSIAAIALGSFFALSLVGAGAYFFFKSKKR